MDKQEEFQPAWLKYAGGRKFVMCIIGLGVSLAALALGLIDATTWAGVSVSMVMGYVGGNVINTYKGIDLKIAQAKHEEVGSAGVMPANSQHYLGEDPDGI